jgi:F-type H+-transporting ATPase subunit delta
VTSPISLFADRPLPALAQHYARALYELCVERAQLPMVEKDLTALGMMLKDSPELRTFIANPLIRRDQMANALEALFEQATFSALSRNFIHIAVQNGRARDLPLLLDGFFACLAAARGQVTADVVSARPLTEAQNAAIVKALTEALAPRGVKEVRLRTHMDENLMGGLSVQVGSWMYDGSLKGRLDALGRQLKG